MTPDFAKQLVEEALGVVGEMQACKPRSPVWGDMALKLMVIITREQVVDPPDPDSGQSQPPRRAQDE